MAFYTELGVGWLSERKTEEHTRSELAYILKFLRKGSKVLDLACGYGRLSIPLASMGFSVEGLDITPDFIKHAREEADRRNLKINFRVGEMSNLPYSENSFAAVICTWNAFSEIAPEKEQLKAILEIYRTLEGGGLAFIEVRNHRSSGLVNENVIDGHEAMPSYSHTRGSLGKLMKASAIRDYKIFLDNFGGRTRLLLEFRKPMVTI